MNTEPMELVFCVRNENGDIIRDFTSAKVEDFWKYKIGYASDEERCWYENELPTFEHYADLFTKAHTVLKKIGYDATCATCCYDLGDCIDHDEGILVVKDGIILGFKSYAFIEGMLWGLKVSSII